MKYLGSKARIADSILPIILASRLPGQHYVEPFVGGCNTIDKVKGRRIGADKNRFLIAMWKRLQSGWEPPSDFPREVYAIVRASYRAEDGEFPDHSIGYVGFNGSYGGKFFGGYAGVVRTKAGKRNYLNEAFRNVMSQVPAIAGVEFVACTYRELTIPPQSLIYCDPPYADTTCYVTGDFDHDKFWQWCRNQRHDGHTVFISEYAAPKDFRCVWEREVSSSLRANRTVSGSKKSVERLFTI